MAKRNLLTFLAQSIVVGLMAAALLYAFKPELFRSEAPAVVEVRESERNGAPSVAPAGGPVSYADAVDRAAPAVVNIYSAKVVREPLHPLFNDPLFRQFFGDRIGPQRERLQTSLGSGVIISPQGYILTNNHVVGNADEIQVMLADGRSHAAKVVGSDPETDLSVLRIEADALPVIVLGDAESLRVGDVVLAIGNPYGVGQTVTQGIVSATGRTQLGISTFENFIQTDAAINPGNSGGALINAHGELIGINTAIFSRSGGSQGIGFAIPESLARDVMKQIIENGQVVRGWLGIEAQDLTPQLAESFGLDSTDGVLIAGVLRGGPADRAGLEPGDVLTGLNGKPVSSSRQAMNAIAASRPGSQLRIEAVRRGQPLELAAEIGRRPQAQQQ
ncbi:Do family serine endopeptidase [Thiohalobacter thiocyanaticus]|uniref:Do family serine endopeptidase n=1 Tax=Thiohalobacter thiocyanaticus TaxID=585455 RepID=A0A426QLH6_9GAMM|nr:Do family serine endopeptidase [Thiohalobacter thiocyanaticus]RRQ22621.1 Do family serine endopeptidase [Thiohalobacter thiocyanaticus]